MLKISLAWLSSKRQEALNALQGSRLRTLETAETLSQIEKFVQPKNVHMQAWAQGCWKKESGHAMSCFSLSGNSARGKWYLMLSSSFASGQVLICFLFSPTNFGSTARNGYNASQWTAESTQLAPATFPWEWEPQGSSCAHGWPCATEDLEHLWEAIHWHHSGHSDAWGLLSHFRSHPFGEEWSLISTDYFDYVLVFFIEY